MAKSLRFSSANDYILGNNYTITYSGDLTAVNTFAEVGKQYVGNGCIKLPATTAGKLTFNMPLANLHTEGKLAFAIYADDDESTVTFNFGTGATITVNCTDINLAFATGTAASSTATPMVIESYYWLDIAWKPATSSFSIKVNNTEVLDTSSQGSIAAFDGSFSIERASVAGDIYIDNLMINRDYDKDTWALRGFDTFTTELPDEPEAADYGIVFSYLGKPNQYGLPAVRHYANAGDTGGKDFTGGSWIEYFNGFPTDHISPTTNPNTGTNYLTGSFDNNRFIWFKTNSPISITDGFSIGCYLHVDEASSASISMSINKDTGNFTDQLWYFSMNDNAACVAVFCYFNNNPIVFDAISGEALMGNLQFVQLSVDYTAETWTLYLNGTAVIDGEITEDCKFEEFDSVYLSFVGTTNQIKGSNLIVSTDKTLNMYTEMVGETRLCDLTEYPKAVA